MLAVFDEDNSTYTFHCQLNPNTTVIIPNSPSINYTLLDSISPDTVVQWLKDAQSNVSQLGMGANNISEGNLTITIATHPDGGGMSMRKKNKNNNYGITVDRSQSKFDGVRKNLLVHEYFHILNH